MSFDPPRIAVNPTDAILGQVVFQMKQPSVTIPPPSAEMGGTDGLPPFVAPTDGELVEKALYALRDEVQGLRRDLWERHQSAWPRRFARWLPRTLRRLWYRITRH